MKELMLVCLLVASAPVMAQNTAAPRSETELAKAEKQREADEQKARAELEVARKRLEEAAREVAELSAQLGRNEGHKWTIIDAQGERRAILGVQIDPQSGKDGARVAKVSPGGAAADAGLNDGDVIVALDDTKVAGAANPNRVVVEHMRKVKPEQKVKVRVLRDGKNKDFIVVARPMVFGDRVFNFQVPEIHGAMAGVMSSMPHIQQFRAFWPGEFGGMELASITPKLGAYFGVTEGVLVVQAPDNSAFQLEDGDVIQAIDGRKPEDGAHALRILRSYKSGEKLNLKVLRQRKPMTLAVTMPERPDFEDHLMPAPPEPPMPPVPGVPSGAGVPGGAATLE